MLSRLRNMFRVPDLRNKILFTLADRRRLPARRAPARSRTSTSTRSRTSRTSANNSGVVGFLDLFSGGAITNVAIFFLGIMPYITASIIMQLLGVVIPKLEQWQQEGQVGQKKITQWTRYLTVAPRARSSRPGSCSPSTRARAACSASPGFRGHRHHPRTSTPARAALIVLTWTAGTALVMWLGELITQRGIGNGMSILIFASVVSTLARAGRRDLERGHEVPVLHDPRSSASR